MSAELIFIAINVANLAIKYGRRVDLLKSGQDILQADFDLPVADPNRIVTLERAIITRLLKTYADNGQDPILTAEARKMAADRAFESNQAMALLTLVMPEKLTEYPSYRAKLAGRENAGDILVLQSTENLPPITRQIIVLATEFIAEAGAGFVPHVIGDAGVQELVKGVLLRFVANGAVDPEGNVYSVLAKRAFNAGMDALATNSAGLRGRSDLLDLGFELITTMKSGMGEDEKSWRTYAKSYFDKGGFVRLVGVMTTVGGKRIADNSGDEEVKKLVTDLAGDLSKQLGNYQGESKNFLRNNWNELIAGSLGVLTSHSGTLLDKEADWIKLVVKATGTALTEVVKEKSEKGGDIARTLVAGISSAFVAKPEVLEAGINEEGLRKLIVSVITPLSDQEGLLKPGLKVDLATRLVSGLVDLAATDQVLRQKIFSDGEAEWIGKFATQFKALADDKSLAGIFNEDGRKKLGAALANAALKAVAEGKSALAESVSEDWLKGVIESLAEAAGSTDFEKIVGKGGLRTFIVSAVSIAEKNPSLLSLPGENLKPLLPVILLGIRQGIEGDGLDRAEIGGLLVEALGGWIGSRKDVQGMDLQPFVTEISKVFADALRSNKIVEPSELGDAIAAVVRGLAGRTDANHLVRPETLGISLAWIMQRGLSPGDLLHAIGRISAHLLETVPSDAWVRILDYNTEEWEQLLRNRLSESIVEIPEDAPVNLRTAVFIGQIDKAIAAIAAEVSQPTVLA